jgi:hypothetical protein
MCNHTLSGIGLLTLLGIGIYVFYYMCKFICYVFNSFDNLFKDVEFLKTAKNYTLVHHNGTTIQRIDKTILELDNKIESLKLLKFKLDKRSKK